LKSIKNIYKAILWAILIFILSSISGNQLNQLPKLLIPHLDKLVHFGLYFIFVLLLISGFNESLNKPKMILAIAISATYGGIIELLQQFVFVKRSMDLYDFAANLSGILLGAILYQTIRKTKLLY
jgi:VanZ family protein